MIIIDPQVAREGISSLVFGIPIFVLMVLGVIHGLVIFDWIEFLVRHGAISGTVVCGH